ncbi:hypothetical protein BVC80_1663g83 [Macleaya cordata]|uniref:Transmembrane protein n=1 Tax=Macleaya cordata TaxID=56857 RepID=A0A200RBX4_MACCD|nr:hypothetical protein BVC80_1663g83 [Macleaya cordata]
MMAADPHEEDQVSVKEETMVANKKYWDNYKLWWKFIINRCDKWKLYMCGRIMAVEGGREGIGGGDAISVVGDGHGGGEEGTIGSGVERTTGGDEGTSGGCDWKDEGQYEADTRRSSLAIMLFRLSVMFITVLGFIVTIMCAYDRISSQYRTQRLSICVVLAAIFAGGSTLYVKLLQWLIQHLHAREDKSWFGGLLMIALCDAFLHTDKMLPLALLSTLSMITLCVLTTGSGFDCTGIPEGLSIGFAKWLLVYMIDSKLLHSVICGLVLLIVIVSKVISRISNF